MLCSQVIWLLGSSPMCSLCDCCHGNLADTVFANNSLTNGPDVPACIRCSVDERQFRSCVEHNGWFYGGYCGSSAVMIMTKQATSGESTPLEWFCGNLFWVVLLLPWLAIAARACSSIVMCCGKCRQPDTGAKARVHDAALKLDEAANAQAAAPHVGLSAFEEALLAAADQFKRNVFLDVFWQLQPRNLVL